MRVIGLWLMGVLLWGCGQEETAGTPEPAEASRAAESATAEERPLVNPFDAEQLRIALAVGAKRLCSEVFVAGREQAHVAANELEDSANQDFAFEVQRNPDAVIASAAGEQATVLHRARLGCTLTVPGRMDEVRAQFDPAAYPPVDEPDPQVPWPEGSAVTLPESVDGLDLAAVQTAVDQAFAEPDPDNPLRTRAVVVVHDGRIVAEGYADPFDSQTPQLGWSMTKTVTNALTGILVKDQVLDVAAPAPVARWQSSDDPRRNITLEHLLHMSSGLEFAEVYNTGSPSDVVSMLFGRGHEDMGAFAANMPLAEPPGSHWSYASGTTNLISRIQRQSFDNLNAYLAFPRERLFNPLGMTSAVIEADVSGTFVGSSYMYATPRDWARIGLLYLQDGVWNGERILPEGWVAYSLAPAPAAGQGQYGAQIWLNRGNPETAAARPHPELPAQMYYLSGFEGQNVVVVPSADLVVVRLGLTRGGPSPVWALTRRILDAIEQAPARRAINP